MSDIKKLLVVTIWVADTAERDHHRNSRLVRIQSTYYGVPSSNTYIYNTAPAKAQGTSGKRRRKL